MQTNLMFAGWPTFAPKRTALCVCFAIEIELQSVLMSGWALRNGRACRKSVYSGAINCAPHATRFSEGWVVERLGVGMWVFVCGWWELKEWPLQAKCNGTGFPKGCWWKWRWNPAVEGINEASKGAIKSSEAPHKRCRAQRGKSIYDSRTPALQNGEMEKFRKVGGVNSLVRQ